MCPQVIAECFISHLVPWQQLLHSNQAEFRIKKPAYTQPAYTININTRSHIMLHNTMNIKNDVIVMHA